MTNMQALTKFLKVIRWKNVAIFLLLQILLYFVFFNKNFDISDAWLFLSLSILSFGIFGNIQNNILDYELDRNKRNFVAFDKTTYIIWAILFIIFGFMFGFASFYFTFSPTLLYAILIFPLSLSLYNTYLKKLPLIGNIVIALLTAFAIYVPVAYAKNIDYQTPTLFFLLIMAFILSLIREIVKDLEDADTDRQFGYKTLAIISPRASIIWLGILYLLYFIFLFRYKNNLNEICFYTLLVLSTLISVLSIKFLKDQNYAFTSSLIKIWMIGGLLITLLLS